MLGILACAALAGCSSPHPPPAQLRAVSYPAVNLFAYDGHSGDMAVSEVFYRKVFASLNLPRRTIVLNDGCVIDATWAPSTTVAPVSCFDIQTTQHRGITNVEAESVLDFWKAVSRQKLAH
jgi:hypothetical protein